jgi:hypothetical protein
MLPLPILAVTSVTQMRPRGGAPLRLRFRFPSPFVSRKRTPLPEDIVIIVVRKRSFPHTLPHPPRIQMEPSTGQSHSGNQ